MINKITSNQVLRIIEANISAELPGKQLWGDLNLSVDEYECIALRLKNVLTNPNVNISYICRQFPNTLTTFLVFLVRYKFDYNFWGLVGQELEIKMTGPIETEIGKCAKNAFKKYQFDLSDVKDARRIYLEPIQYEAGIPPESSLDDLFYLLNYDSHAIFDPQLVVDDLVEMRSFQIRKPLLKFLKRFKDDRALEFVLDVHDAMLSVDQGMNSESHFIGNYVEWKKFEKSKEAVTARKSQDAQAKPYLVFENGKRGLCLVLPRVIMKHEWTEEAEWVIRKDDGGVIHRRVTVFGDEGRRFVETITVPVSPSREYAIDLLDDENLEDETLLSWTIDGVRKGNPLFFNSNGRMITANYIPSPNAIIILGDNTEIIEYKNLNVSYQSYPTDRIPFKILEIEPTGRDAQLSYLANGVVSTITTRPQIDINLEGRTLFGLPETDLHLFTEIPSLTISVDEGTIINGLELHIGKTVVNIDKYFKGGRMVISLKSRFSEIFSRYGIYSIRLYQYDHFLKQVEFGLVPKIKTNYNPCLSWPDSVIKRTGKILKFEKKADWVMEFTGAIVSSDEREYVVNCSPNIGSITVLLKNVEGEDSASFLFDLPVNPFAVDILNEQDISIDVETKSVRKLNLSDLKGNEYWVSLKCFGNYRKKAYSLRLRTENGIEQEEQISLAQNSCGNFNLASFCDTLNTCPLPAQIELCCNDNSENGIPVLLISDNEQLSAKAYYANNGYVVLKEEDDKKDLIIKRFGLKEQELVLLYEKSKLNKRGLRGYKCPELLIDGIYSIESSKQQSAFEFEDEGEIRLSNDFNTIYVSSRNNDAAINCFSDWLDQLIKDIISTGMGTSLQKMKSNLLLSNLKELKNNQLTDMDYEKIVALAYFYNAKASNSKKDSIQLCMQRISQEVLTADFRLNIIRILDKMQCPSEIFDICLQNYNLYLFLPGSSDAKKLSAAIETKSVELSMLLRMGVDDSVRNTVWPNRFRELIGREAIRSLLSVPNTSDEKVIAEEQKKFLREQIGSCIHINLTKDISGDMEPIVDMIEIGNKVFFNKSKKPDIGIYFDHIRYVDQYVNWYNLYADKNAEIYPDVKKNMVDAVLQYGKNLMKEIDELKKFSEIKSLIERYESALSARYDKDPLANMNSPIPARFLYLQGMAALIAKLPVEYRGQGWNISPAEHFMVSAMAIAPRIARRDLIMASTYIYLVRKEKKLCR